MTPPLPAMKPVVSLPPMVVEAIDDQRELRVCKFNNIYLSAMTDAEQNSNPCATGETPRDAIANLELKLQQIESEKP